MGRVKEGIEEAGITPGKVGACLLIHEIIGETLFHFIKDMFSLLTVQFAVTILISFSYGLRFKGF